MHIRKWFLGVSLLSLLPTSFYLYNGDIFNPTELVTNSLSFIKHFEMIYTSQSSVSMKQFGIKYSE